MKSQKSFQTHETGTLYLVATPIGNLEDMTVRAIRTLQEVDWIAAEDTRNTKKLCNHFEISTPLFSYHEHNIEASGEKLLQYLLAGKNVALVSDAGLPCISDPGQDIVRQATDQQIPVVPIPGANAALTALIASGISPQPFLFYGFLSRQKKERQAQLNLLQYNKETIIFYEAPHRLKDMIYDMEKVFGNERRIVLARELTKKFEEFKRGTLEEAKRFADEGDIRGEFVVIVEGSNEEAPPAGNWWDELSVEQHVDHVMEKENLKPKDAIKEVAKARQLSSRDVYQIYHGLEK